MLYPEQNEARLKLSLDGTWAFALGSCVEDQFDPAKPLPDAQPIAVPASYNDQNDQTTALRRHYGWAWYQRKVTLPTFCAGQRVVLRFGSVTHTANVWLNGQLIAQHKGGFTPFEADVTALLHPGETVLLTVACDNRVNHSTLPVGNEDGQLAFFGSDNAGIPSVEAAKRAAAPQNRPNFDFFNYAGIHRPVWLYTTPKEYIEDVTVVPAVDGTVQYAVKTTGSAPVHVTVLDADGKAIIEEKEIRIPMFKVVSVFDVSQTAGKPLPQLAADLSGNVQQYEVFMEALRRASPVPMEIKPVARDTDGFFSIKAQSITIRAGMSEVQTVCAAVHEIAHAKLHDYEHMTELADDGETILVPGEKSRNTEEVEAESISYAVCQYYGIETGENSFGYIATWSKGKELKELRASLETINKTASELITDIDRHFAEIFKERGINREEVSATQTDEALYLVDGSVYLHVQHTDGGWDYSLYDKESKKLLDGGVIDSSAIEDSPVASIAGAVRTEVFAIQGMTPTKVTFADMKILEDLQEAQITPPLDSEQITGAVAVPTDAADNMLPELEQAVPMPDPTLTVDDMRSYGYLDSDMLPLSKDRAVELLEHDITVYMLYPDNAEEMVFEAEDIIKHDGMFGVTRPDWDAVKGHIPPRDVEQRFLNSPTDAMAIYQLRRDAPVELRFANLGSLAAPPDPANYEAVYTREVYPDDDTGRILENFYYIFNDERPGDFVGHSLSVSDIVALKQDGKVSYHYCDSMGFQELPAFQKPENYLKAAEMSMEDDYGMIDGIINNGPKQPTVADLEAQVKAGMSISLMDLAEAAHREKKKSVLEQLKSQPAQERPHKTAPKKSAEKEL